MSHAATLQASVFQAAARPARVTLRPVTPADAAAMEAFVAGLGPRSRRYRFHGAVNGCTDALLRLLTHVDGRRHVAFVACVGDRIVGEARYFVAPDGRSAEFAIAVAETFQGRGVAASLMDALDRAARAAGIRTLYGDALHDNGPMEAFMRRHGFEIDLSDWERADGRIVRWQRTVGGRRALRLGGLLAPLARLAGLRVPSIAELFDRFALRLAGMN